MPWLSSPFLGCSWCFPAGFGVLEISQTISGLALELWGEPISVFCLFGIAGLISGLGDSPKTCCRSGFLWGAPDRLGPSCVQDHFGSLFLAVRRLDAFGRGRDLETAQTGVDESNGKTDLHVRLRTYTSSSYFCLEGLGCKVGPALVRTTPPPNNFRTLNQELFEGGPGMVIVLVLVSVSVLVLVLVFVLVLISISICY